MPKNPESCGHVVLKQGVRLDFGGTWMNTSLVKGIIEGRGAKA
jgi:hypothetical protein